MDTLSNITCYKQSAEECDEESHTCENCGKVMCFSHSNRASATFCDDAVNVCDDCLDRR